jgi:phage terminase Nu1 subunit (DNA packaging protein)
MPKVKQPAKHDALAIDDVAELLMCDPRTIRNWLKDRAMPSVKDERGRRFTWSEVLPWYVKMKADDDGNARKKVLAWPPPAPIAEPTHSPEWDETYAERVRQDLLRKAGAEAVLRAAIATADLRELELAERRGQVVAVEDVSRAMQDTSKNLQTKILGWPTLMIGRVFGVRDRNQLFGVLTSSARALCSDLASGQEPDA